MCPCFIHNFNCFGTGEWTCYGFTCAFLPKLNITLLSVVFLVSHLSNLIKNLPRSRGADSRPKVIPVQRNPERSDWITTGAVFVAPPEPSASLRPLSRSPPANVSECHNLSGPPNNTVIHELFMPPAQRAFSLRRCEKLPVFRARIWATRIKGTRSRFRTWRLIKWA